VFSLAPLFIISISLAGIIFGEDAARGEITKQISGMVGSQAADTIQSLVVSASMKSSGVWATILGLLVLLFGASSVFGELRSALNTIWGVVPKPGRPFFTLFLDRLLSFAMVLIIGFLLLASLLASAVLSATSKFFAAYVSVPKGGWHTLDLLISLVVITALFAMIFKILPNAIISWRDVSIGAWVTSLLFTIGKLLIGIYLGRSGVASAFGAAGSIVIILLWIYYSACILFFGAEFTKAYACHSGKGVVPDKWAVIDPHLQQPTPPIPQAPQE
jgi:membrane protein